MVFFSKFACKLCVVNGNNVSTNVWREKQHMTTRFLGLIPCNRRQKSFISGLPELLSKDIYTKRCNGYSFRGKDCLLVPTFNTRCMKDSLAYRGSIFWNTVSFSEHGVSQLKQRELKHRLKTKHYFKDFKLIVISASTVRHRDDNFIYIWTFSNM